MRRGVGAVVGLDLSLTRAAAVRLSSNWQPGEWHGVLSKTVGWGLEKATLQEQADRLTQIAHALAEWCDPEDVVAVEDYVGGLAKQGGLRLAELGGAVKVLLFDRGIVAEPVNVSTARKTFLGKVPQGKGVAQAAVHDALRRMGAPWEGSDEGDAFCIANHLRSRLGLSCATLGAG